MQYVNCDVLLNGDRNHCVPKTRVSVAEVVVLRALHGADSVANIQRVGERRANAAEEVARLCRVYPSRAAEIRQSIFPGANPSVPISLKDIGAEPDAPKSKPSNKKAGKASADKSQPDDGSSDDNRDGGSSDDGAAHDSDPLE